MRPQSRWSWPVASLAAALSAIALWRAGRGLTFYWDEWNFVLDRRAFSADALLRDHNGHFTAVPVLVYQLLWHLFGLRHYRAFLVVLTAYHVTASLLLFTLLKRRASAVLALSGLVIVLFLGLAYQVLLWPFSYQYLGSLVGVLAALVLLDRRDRHLALTRAAAASACLLFGLASSGLSVPLTIGITVELLWRKETRRSWWVPVAPLVVYACWFARYGVSQATTANLRRAPSFVTSEAAAAAGAATGFGLRLGRVVLALLVALLAWGMLRRRVVTPRLAMALTAMGGFWVISALTRGALGEPDSSRYLYPGVVLILLVAGEVWVPLGRRSMASIGAGAVGAVVLAHSLWVNGHALRDRGRDYRALSTYVRAELGAVELARGQIDQATTVDAARMPQVRAGAYLAAVDDLGSPAMSPSELARQAPEVLVEVDPVLATATRVRLEPSPESSTGDPSAPPAPRPGRTTNLSTSDSRPGCLALVPTATGAEAELTVPPGGISVTVADGTVQVTLRLFAAAYGPALGTITPDTPRAVVAGPIGDHGWIVRLAVTGPATVCAR